MSDDPLVALPEMVLGNPQSSDCKSFWLSRFNDGSQLNWPIDFMLQHESATEDAT